MLKDPVVASALVIACVFTVVCLVRAAQTKDRALRWVAVLLAVACIMTIATVAWADCPPEGDGGDPALNVLKNRTDKPRSSLAMTVPHVLSLPMIKTKLERARWSAQQRKTIGDLEGAAVAVTGYLIGAKEEGAESANCHGAEHDDHDFHVFIANLSTDDKAAAMVVEITPRQHDKRWTLAALHEIVRSRRLVRVTGWLLYDQEHGADVGKARGTLWEIHPLTALEENRDGGWYPVGAP